MYNNLKENEYYLTKQIITYLGNKRNLLNSIEEEIIKIKKKIKKDKVIFMDVFSGSGIVSRMMKKHSKLIIANDLELYSKIINSCYLSNYSDFNEEEYLKHYQIIEKKISKELIPGIISKNYAPEDDGNIQKNDRVFYTAKNAKIIDTIRCEINNIPENHQKYFLAPLIYSASVNNNTGGVFKGFYKDSRTGIGKFGGNGENALNRITGEITLLKPIFSNFSCDIEIYKEDSNQLVKSIDNLDIAYVDPPYNQHPYGSNYFMLNAIAENSVSSEISKVSGIPTNWNRSNYNKKQFALKSLSDLIKNIKSKYIIISYNSEGFIKLTEMREMLEKIGELKLKEIKYNTYRASKNLRNRDLYVTEYLLVLNKEV